VQRKPVPPWQFELRKLPAESSGGADGQDDADAADEEVEGDEGTAAAGRRAAEAAAASAASGASPAALDHLYCHVLDWQAPRNYVFVPRWMMVALQLKPREVAELTWVRLREAAQVKSGDAKPREGRQERRTRVCA
jgi:hypothetical protein